MNPTEVSGAPSRLTNTPKFSIPLTVPATTSPGRSDWRKSFRTFEGSGYVTVQTLFRTSEYPNLPTGTNGPVAKLERGEGTVVRAAGKPCAVHRDDRGELHAVSAVCTHLGCLVAFNNAERTWECPCHGSRFGVDGEVLQGPALEPLEPRDPSDL